MWKVTVHTPKYRHTQQSKRNQTKVSTSWSLHCIITSSSLQVRCSDSRNTHTHQRARQDTCTSVLAEIYVELGLHTHVWSGRICIRLFAPLQCMQMVYMHYHTKIHTSAYICTYLLSSWSETTLASWVLDGWHLSDFTKRFDPTTGEELRLGTLTSTIGPIPQLV